MKQEKWVKFIPKSEQVAQILKQVPRGVRGVFIEQAILEFASKKPAISFYFDGITKPKRKRRSKEEIARDKALKAKEEDLKNQNKENTSPLRSSIKVDINSTQEFEKEENLQNTSAPKGKMMFGFKNMGG